MNKKPGLNYFKDQDERVDRTENKRLKAAKANASTNAYKLRVLLAEKDKDGLKKFAYKLYQDSIEGQCLEEYLIVECRRNAFRYNWDAARYTAKLTGLRQTIRYLHQLSEEYLQYLMDTNQYRMEF